MLKESKADIFVDPVLHTACALDLKHQCAAIPPGRGRREYKKAERAGFQRPSRIVSFLNIYISYVIQEY